MAREDLQVLVVDDDPGIRRALFDRLTNAGFAVQTVSSGEEALGVFTDPAADLPDVVVLDIKLPGADGYEVCERIRQTVDAPQLAVVFLTGVRHAGTQSPLDQLVTQAGGDYFLSKPYDPHLLIRLLDRIESELGRQPRRTGSGGGRPTCARPAAASAAGRGST